MSNKFKIIIIIIGLLLLLFASTLVLSTCGNSESHTHQYSEWSVTRTATCTEAGEEARFCSCGDTQTRTIPTKGHSYSEWSVTRTATCTEAGEEARFCSCGDTQTRTIPAKGHSYSEWVVVKEATCAQEGERYSICSACSDKKTESLSKSSTHTYNEGTITKSPTCTASGSKTVVCTVCNATKEESIPPLGHSVDNTGKCSRCGLVTLNMTNSEIEKSKKIETISYSVSEFSDEIIINITLKDGAYSVQVPVYVDVKIVDDNGNILYSKTIIKKSSQSKVTIDYDEITNAFTNTGTLYYTVYNDYVSFDTISKELEEIPWTVTIELPSVPQTISYNGYYASSCKVTGITYEVSGDWVTFYFTGEKTYDKKGNSYSQSCKIGWKLYDEDGYVVDDGTCYTTSIKVGEKFKDASCIAYDVIEQGKTYRLVIMNVS